MPSAAALIFKKKSKTLSMNLEKMEGCGRGGISFLQDVHIYEGKYGSKEEIKNQRPSKMTVMEADGTKSSKIQMHNS